MRSLLCDHNGKAYETGYHSVACRVADALSGRKSAKRPSFIHSSAFGAGRIGT